MIKWMDSFISQIQNRSSDVKMIIVGYLNYWINIIIFRNTTIDLMLIVNSQSITFLFIFNILDMENNQFRIGHQFDTQIKYLSYILKEEQLFSAYQLKQLKFPAVFNQKLKEQRLQFIKNLFKRDEEPNLINTEYLQNFIAILTFKLALALVKKKKIQKRLEISIPLNKGFLLQNYKKMIKREELKKLIDLVKEIFQKQIKGVLATEVKDIKQNSLYTFMLVGYYYYLKQSFIDQFQFQQMKKIKKQFIKMKNIYKLFYLDFCKELRYFTKKRSQQMIIDDQTIKDIFESLKRTDIISEKIQICLSQIIRNIILNGYKEFKLQELYETSQNTTCKDIKNPIYQSIVFYQNSKQGQQLIKKIIQSNQDIQFNNYLIQRKILHNIEKTQKNFKKPFKCLPKRNANSLRNIENYSFRNNLKEKHLATIQEEMLQTQFQHKLSINQIKETKKEIIFNHPKFTILAQTEGSDIPTFGGTFTSVKVLFQNIQKGLKIKRKDKQYIQQKFMEKKYKKMSKGLLGQLLIDVMIAKIYQAISKNNLLKLQSIQNLINKCIGNQQTFQQNYVRNNLDPVYINKYNSLVQQFQKNIDQYAKQYQFFRKNEEHPFSKKISKIISDIKNKQIIKDKKIYVKQMIEDIRVCAIAAIYNICCSNQQKLIETFQKYLLKIINQQLCGYKISQQLESDYFNNFLNLCILKQHYFQQDQNAQKLLFNACIQELKNKKSKQLCLKYIKRLSQDNTKHDVIFKDSEIEKIVKQMSIQEDQYLFKEMFKIIALYLLNITLKPISLSSFQLLRGNSSFRDAKKQFYANYYLNTKKQRQLDINYLRQNEIIDKFVSEYTEYSSSIKEQEQNIKYAILLILFNFSKKLSIQKANLFTPLLHININVRFDRYQLVFDSQNIRKQDVLVSQIAAHIIYNSLELSSYNLQIKLQPILQSLQTCNFRTKVVLANLLEKYSDKRQVSKIFLVNLQQHFSQQIFQIKYRLIKTYLNIQKKVLDEELNPNELHQILLLEKIYLDEEDISLKTNQQILALLSKYIKSGKFKQFTQIKTFNIITYFLSANNYQNVNTCLQILDKYSQKFFIPKDVLQVVDNVIERKCFSTEQMDQIGTIKQNIYNNLIKNNQQITFEQVNLWVSKLLSCQDTQKGKTYFSKLDKISKNQDLPDKIFNIIQVQRCCKLYSESNNLEKQKQLQNRILAMTEEGTPLNNNLSFKQMTTSLQQQSLNIVKILHNLSFSQKIPMHIIYALLAIYKTKREDNNYEKQKLIARIVVNTYLEYQCDQILNQNNFIRSVDSNQLLSIALPVILKQKFEQKIQNTKYALNKIIQFYKETQDVRHKQLISFLFNNRDIVLNIINCQSFQQKAFFPKQNYTDKLKQNCLKLITILKEKGSSQCIKYMEERQQQIALAKKQMQLQELERNKKLNSLKNKNLKDIIIYNQKQQKDKSNLISQLIAQIIQPVSNSISDNYKRDYLYNLNDLQVLIHSLQTLNQSTAKRSILQRKYLEIIIIISSINQSHIYEEILINNPIFISLIEKIIKANYLQKQLLQIYVKIIENRKCIQFGQIFNIIVNSLKSSHPKQILMNLLLIIQRAIANYSYQLREFIDQEQRRSIILSVIQSHTNNSFENIRYISIKILKTLKTCLGFKSQILYDLSNKIFQSSFNLFSTQTVDQYLQILCLLQKDIINIVSQNQQKIIYEMIFKAFLFKVSKDDGKKIKMALLWNKHIHLIEDIKLYLNYQKQISYQNVYQFIEYFIFNNQFDSKRMRLINNIKNHKFQESKLTKMLIHHYLLSRATRIQAEPQKMITICFNQQIKNIDKFLKQIYLLNSKQSIEFIQKMLKNQISLSYFFQISNKVTLNDIKSLSIFKQIIKSSTFSQKNHHLQRLIVVNMGRHSSQLIELLIQKVQESFGKQQIDYYIQLLELTSHFQNSRQKYLQIIKKIKCQNSWQFFAALNTNYITQICHEKKDRSIQECVNNVTFYPLQNSYLYKNANTFDYFKYTINYIITKQLYESSFRKLKFFNKSKYLREWQDDDFKRWSALIKENIDYTKEKQFNKEALLIIKTAIYNTTSNKTFRNNQLISCLMMLNEYQTTKENKGRLLQISTGQGKSTIICAVAIILALKGNQVDIVTTTSILAQRDVKEFQKIYQKFSITVADNVDKEPYLNGPKKCYESMVVYGQVSQFQFDYLRDKYNEYNTLGMQGNKRSKKYVIVDEVDSMLIDDSSKIAKISSNILGIQKLEIIYVLIWQKLLKIRQNILEFEDKYYYFDGRFQEKQGKITFFYTSQNSIINPIQQPIEDLNKYMAQVHKNTKKLISKITQIKKKSRQTIKQLLMKLYTHIKEPNNQDNHNIYIPSNFEQFVKIQFPRWVQSALHAQQFQQNIDYIIENQSISPVDYDNTGKIQHSTHWANGLHQFLQLKHFLKLTPENLTTNFISNISYFRIYDHLIGVTGTIGSDKCKQVLCQTYKVDIIFIPDSFDKKLVQYPSKMLENTEKWAQKIITSTQYELHKNRGVLIICETIEYCNYLFSKLKEKNHNNKIKLYTMNDKDQEKDIKSIDKNEIIIATNLAGRGTDINTIKIQSYGGLHVIITFLPKNLRVQYQAKGRTARNGNFGSCEVIVNKLLLSKDQNQSNYFQLRNQQQQKRLDDFFNQEMKKIQIKDQIFLEFCDFLKNMRKKLQKRLQSVKSKQSKLQKQIKINKKPDNRILQNNILAIQQKWAFFLNSQEFDKSFQIKTFKQFLQDIQIKISNECKDNLVKNPYGLALNGFQFLISKFQAVNMIKHFTNEYIDMGANNFLLSIKQDRNIISSWAGLGQVSLCLQNNEITNKCFSILKIKFANYKQLAIYCYEQAQKLLKNELSVIETIQKYSMMSSSQRSLYNQTLARLQILTLYLDSVTKIIKQIKKSQKRITIRKKIEKQQIYHDVQFTEIERKQQYLEYIKSLDYKDHKNQICFHHLNSNNNNQTKAVFKLLESQVNEEKYSQIDFLNLEIIDLTCNQTNLLLLNSILKTNLNSQKAIKFIDNHKKQKKTDTKYLIQSIESNFKIQINNKQDSLTYFKNLSQQQADNTYNIIIQNSPSIIQEYLKTCKITIKCQRMNFQKIKSVLEQIQCQSYRIQVLLDLSSHQISQYLNKFTKQIQKQTTIFVEKDMKQYNQQQEKAQINKKQTIRVKFTKEQKYDVKKINKIIFVALTKEEAKKICQKLQDQLFTITFQNYKKASIFNSKDAKFNILLHSTCESPSKQKLSTIKGILSNIIKQKRYKFNVIIKNIDEEKIMKLAKVKLQQQDILIISRKEICQYFPKITAPFTQIYQYMSQGIQYVLQTQQEKALPVKQLFAIGSLAFLEIVVGTLLTSSGIGAIIGLPLIIQSVADIITLGITAKTRQFNWKFFAFMKLFSIGSAVGLNFWLKSFCSISAVGGFSLGASLASISKMSGLRSLSMLQIQLLNNIKLKSEQLMKESIINSSINKQDFEYKKLINQIILNKVSQYFKQKNTLKEIISKMMMLDNIQQSSLWQKKIIRIIKQIIFSNQMQEQIQYLVNKISKKMKSDEKDNFYISLKNNKYLNTIIIKFSKDFQIRIYQIQQSLLGVKYILKKYSNITQQQCNKIYKHLLKTEKFPRKQILKINGQDKYFKNEIFDLVTIKEIKTIHQQNIFLKKCEEDMMEKRNKQKQSESYRKIAKLLSQQISNLLIDKLIQAIANPFFNDYSAYSTKNIRQTFIKSQQNNTSSHNDNDIIINNQRICHRLIREQSQMGIQQNISIYSQLVLVKQATPVDILLLLDHFKLKVNLINDQYYKGLSQKGQLRYKFKQNGEYQYEKKQNKLDAGFKEFAELEGSNKKIQVIRNLYSQLVLQEQNKLIDYLKIYWFLYGQNYQIIQEAKVK